MEACVHPRDITNPDTSKSVLLVVGAIGLVSGAWMAFSFGKSMSWAHGITLCLLAVLCAFMPARIDHFRRHGRKGLANSLAVLCCVFIAAEYFSHLGYTIGNRVESTEAAEFHNGVKLASAKAVAVDRSADVARWKARQATLEAERSALVKANPWATQVEPEALQTQLEAARLAEKLEAARGGCKDKCKLRKDEVAAIEQKISTIRKANAIGEEVAKLDAEIKAAQVMADSKAKDVITVGHKVSPIVSQTKFVGQLWTASLEPDAEAMNWTQIAIGALIALVTTFLAPISFLMAFGDTSGPGGSGENSSKVTQPQPLAPSREILDALASMSRPVAPAAAAGATTSITVLDGGGGLVDQITALCRKHTEKMAA